MNKIFLIFATVLASILPQISNGATVEYPLTFKIEIDGLKVPFSQIVGIGIDFEDLSEKATGAAPVMVSKKGASRTRDIMLSRKFDGDMTLFKWVKEQTKSKDTKLKKATIEVLDGQKKVIARYHLASVWPKSWTGPGLASEHYNARGETTEELVLSVSSIDVD